MIYDKPKLDFCHVLLRPNHGYVNSRSEVDLNSSTLKQRFNITTNGIIAANMDGVGTIEVAAILKEEGCMTALHKHYDESTLIDYFSSDESSHSFYSMGISDSDYEKFTKVMASIDRRNLDHPLKVCIDVANGYMDRFGVFCREIKRQYPEFFVMAGNVVDVSGISNLRGVDSVKCGIGSGSNCLTRTQTGVGYPQLSCIYDIVSNPRYQTGFSDILICSDGGCVTPGDISKAFAIGSDMVMIGGMLAGTDQGGGDIIEIDGKKFVQFYGMSSVTAQNKHNGGLKDYRSSEGRTTLVPYKGDVRDVIRNIKGGIVSTCSYLGVESLEQLHTRAHFIPVLNTINRSMEQHTVGM